MAKRTDSGLASVNDTGQLLQAAADMHEAATGQQIVFKPAEIQEPDTPIDPIENVRAQLSAGGDGSFVTITRIGENGKPDTSCGRMDALTFDVENVRSAFGAGTYRFLGYKRKTVGNGVLMFGNYTLTLEAPRNVLPIAQSTAPNNDMVNLIGAMQQGFNRLGELIITATKAPTRAEMLEEMRIMRDMFAQPQSNVQPAVIGDQLGALESVMNLAEKFAERSGNGGNADPVTDIVKTLIETVAPALMPLLQAKMAGQVPGAIIAPETAPKALTAPTNAPNTIPLSHSNSSTVSAPESVPSNSQKIVAFGEETDMNALMQKMLNMQLREMVDAAQRNSDTDLYAELLLDRLPVDRVIAFLQDSTWFAQVCALDPRAANYQDWFTRLSASVQVQLTDNPEDDTQESRLSPIL